YDRHDAAHHHRELGQPELVELLALERRVGGAEGHGLGLNLLDAAAGADRLIVQPDVGFLLIGVRPFGVDRVRERCACAGNSRRACRGCDDGCEGRRYQCVDEFQGTSPCLPKTECSGQPSGPQFYSWRLLLLLTLSARGSSDVFLLVLSAVRGTVRRLMSPLY